MTASVPRKKCLPIGRRAEMGDKRSTKNPPAEAAEASDRQSFIEWKREHVLWKLLQRRPFVFDELETKLIQGGINAAVAGVAAGRSSSAVDLLMYCEAFLRAGLAPPEPANAWLVERLEQMASSDSPWGLPLLSRGRGQKGADEWPYQFVVASYYDQLLQRGEKHEVAWRETRDFMGFMVDGLTEAKIKHYWRKFRRTRPDK